MERPSSVQGRQTRLSWSGRATFGGRDNDAAIGISVGGVDGNGQQTNHALPESSDATLNAGKHAGIKRGEMKRYARNFQSRWMAAGQNG